MYERFTDRGRKIMQLAQQEAQRLNHGYVGTEHLLCALIKEGSGVATNVLKNLGLDLSKIRSEVEKHVQAGPDEYFVLGKLPLTPLVLSVLRHAADEADRLSHTYVGTEHLLLGLLREQESIAAKVLTGLGLKLEDVRAETLRLLGHDEAPAISWDASANPKELLAGSIEKAKAETAWARCGSDDVYAAAAEAFEAIRSGRRAAVAPSGQPPAFVSVPPLRNGDSYVVTFTPTPTKDRERIRQMFEDNRSGSAIIIPPISSFQFEYGPESAAKVLLELSDERLAELGLQRKSPLPDADKPHVVVGE